MWPWNAMDDLETLNNNRALLLYCFKLCASLHSHWEIYTGVQKRPIWVKINDSLSRVTLKFGRWLWKRIGHLFYTTVKLCSSFEIQGWIQTGVTVWKPSILCQNQWFFFSHVRWIFDRWPEQITGHLFYTTLSFSHNFKAISESKLGLQSSNTQFGSKLVIFFTHVTSKFHGWPWKTIGCLFYASSSLCIMS